MDQTIDLLQRWSVGVQFAVVVLLASFFVALMRSVRLTEVRVWATAWASNAVALAAVFVALLADIPRAALPLVMIVYAAGKTAFAVLILAGARFHLQPGVRLHLSPGRFVLLVAVWAVAIGVLTPHLMLAQLAQSLMVGLLMVTGAFWVLRHPLTTRARWLGVAMAMEGALFLHYVPLLAPGLWGAPPLSLGYTHVTSFLDAFAELFLGLAILSSLQSSVSMHLETVNQALLASQEQLRQLVDLDPLTGLRNRRGLRRFLDSVRDSGGTIIVLDIDGFKRTNDRHGHLVGDACLARVAEALRAGFRASDGIFRWGGDEFLVVCPAMEMATARERIERVREVLEHRLPTVPACPISVGMAPLTPGAEPKEALSRADTAMYDSRRERLAGSS